MVTNLNHQGEDAMLPHHNNEDSNDFFVQRDHSTADHIRLGDGSK